MVIYDPVRGKVELARCFDVQGSGPESFEEFADAAEISNGRVLIVGCQGPGLDGLSERTKRWFKDMGSKEVEQLGPRCRFAFIAVWGKGMCSEKRAQGEVVLTQILNMDSDLGGSGITS